ncbi:Protein Tube [Eufriesea mexicana]|uniref:Protein Tube n=1 Tax=Eufriesea mexicana TaxID=516756 RepID=A0A310S8L0_9HYME|nr:PREDICTED: uncharacterized protein LOC108553171 [Eufriesea mexicana]OAD52968.1 Protein Tube [Eufriesea mexicana]
MSQNSVCLNTELRKLRPAELYKLGQILNVSDSWKKLMAIVPKENVSNIPKFNTEHFSMIEQAVQQQRNAAEIFLSEWGTMGKNRPTLGILLNLLVKAELFRAADYVAGEILNVELPKRPKRGPAAPIDISENVIRKLLEVRQEHENFNFSESLIFELPLEVDDNKTINSNPMNHVINNSSLERNMQSTKLISSKGKHNEKLVENNDRTLNPKMSDLMKFSSEQDIEECKKQEQIFGQQEILSNELPVFLNEFGQTTRQAELNQEILSEELPIFLNNSAIMLNKTLSDYEINNSLHLSNLNINENEITSTELPQCVVELYINNVSNLNNTGDVENNENVVQNAVNSEELPITVLEYNKDL